MNKQEKFAPKHINYNQRNLMTQKLGKFIILLSLLNSTFSFSKDCLISILPDQRSDLNLPIQEISDFLIDKGYYVEIPDSEDGPFKQNFLRLGAFSQYIQRHYDEGASDWVITMEEIISNAWSGKSMAYINFKVGDEKEKIFEIKTRFSTMTNSRAEKNLISLVRRRIPLCD